jgi:hypothetical protein
VTHGLALRVEGADRVVDMGEHRRHALRARRRRGQEAQVGAVLLEGAVGDEAMQVYVKAEVTAKALDDRDHACVQ